LLEAYPSLTPADVKDVLMRTAKNLGLDGNTQGAGRAQVYIAYASLKPVGPPPTPGPTPGPIPGPEPGPGPEPEGCLKMILRALGLAK
jgi:hypothetical protein